ncbi:MAG: transglycosylase SLT domain-containing protein [Treponema sp.]|nr:transglycosylase SLT domain-containing protein [Treponema sp.]
MSIFRSAPCASKKIAALFTLILIVSTAHAAGNTQTKSTNTKKNKSKTEQTVPAPRFDSSYTDAEENTLEDEIRDTSIPEQKPISMNGEEVEEEDIPYMQISGPAKNSLDLPEQQNGYVHVDVGIPGLEKELTQKYIKYYQGSEGRKILAKALKNSVPYRPYVIQSLEKNNLPLYLQYLPIIESDYKPAAVSRSGATGIWQFMANSMAPLMKKNKWADDRRDPWHSTDAAMLKFKDNYNFFHDWSLAIAAYNCGAGALLRLVKANPGLDYWGFCEKKLLKNETINYLPKLIAVAEIVENAGYYGLDDIKEAAVLKDSGSIEEYDYIQTKTMLTFAQLSAATGLPKETLKQLNLALLGDCTPFGELYNLRLPKGYADNLKEGLKKIGLSTESQIHTVEKGDTLWALSRKYEVTVSQLCLANGRDEKQTLRIGEQLVVPIF